MSTNVQNHDSNAALTCCKQQQKNHDVIKSKHFSLRKILSTKRVGEGETLDFKGAFKVGLAESRASFSGMSSLFWSNSVI